MDYKNITSSLRNHEITIFLCHLSCKPSCGGSRGKYSVLSLNFLPVGVFLTFDLLPRLIYFPQVANYIQLGLK